MRRGVIAAVVCLLAAVAPLRAQEADSVLVCGSEAFRAQQLIAPALLIGGGFAATYSPWFQTNVNIPVRDYVVSQDFTPTKVDFVMSCLPSAAYVGLDWIGVDARHSGKERIAAFTTALALQQGAVQALKYTTSVMRPDDSTANSFPSSHTSMAFMGAELIRIEYGPWWGLGAYTLATGTALMRLYNNRHWVSDLLGGAGIGILSAQAAYWLLPLERRLLKWDTICIVPGEGGLALSIVF